MYKSICFFSHSVPPLTQGNVLEAVKRVQDWGLLMDYFGIYSASSLEDVVEQFLLGRSFYQPSWRAIIFTLDIMEEIQIADRIRNHGEPVQGAEYKVTAGHLPFSVHFNQLAAQATSWSVIYSVQTKLYNYQDTRSFS
jgi:hypothetical protein